MRYFSASREIFRFTEKYKHFLIITDIAENSYLCTPAGRLDLTYWADAEQNRELWQRFRTMR